MWYWRKAFLIAALLCAGGSSIAEPAGTSPAAPPPQAAQPPAPTDVKAYGDWVVRCFPIKSLAPCDMFQASSDKASHRRIVSTSIAYAPRLNGYVARIIVPLGVKLAAGATVASGKDKGATLAFVRCEGDGCYSEGRLDAALIDKLANGTSAGVNITLLTGRPAALPLSLRGFADAAAAMKALAMQKSQTSAPPTADK